MSIAKKNYCPVCKTNITGFGKDPLYDRVSCICPVCGSKDRHRLITLYLEQKTEIFQKSAKVLEVGPVYGFSEIFRRNRRLRYSSIGIQNPLATKDMDLTSLNFRSESFDYIFCLHVLEHIHDDQKAIEELTRVLKKNGICFIMVPIDIHRKKTFEKKRKILTPSENEKLFGHKDHVRVYGKDFVQKLEKGGFSVEAIDYAKEFSSREKMKFGLFSTYSMGKYRTDNMIYICRRK